MNYTDKRHLSIQLFPTYHKFVKTTPNPSATKNNNGELVGPPPLPLLGVAVEAGGTVTEDEGAEMKAEADEDAAEARGSCPGSVTIRLLGACCTPHPSEQLTKISNSKTNSRIQKFIEHLFLRPHVA